MIQAPVLGWTPPAYDDIVNTYGLDILTVPGNFSIFAGDLAMTKDGDFKMGDTTYNGLFKLVQARRYNVHHLRFLFEMMHVMSVHRRRLDDKMNRIGEDRHARFSMNTYLQPDPIFAEAFHAVTDDQGTAEFGFGTFAGCLVMLLSGSLLRFKDDIDASANDWTHFSMASRLDKWSLPLRTAFDMMTNGRKRGREPQSRKSRRILSSERF